MLCVTIRNTLWFILGSIGCAIIAIKNAGLAISQGIWSSLIVIVSFTWGIIIFEEKVKSITGACVAVIMMMIGLCGKSYFSSEQKGEVQYHNVIDAPPPPTTLELVPSQFDIIDHNNTSSMVYNEKNYDDTKMTKNNKKLSCDVDNLDSHNIINDEVSFCNLKVSRRTFGLLFAIFSFYIFLSQLHIIFYRCFPLSLSTHVINLKK